MERHPVGRGEERTGRDRGMLPPRRVLSGPKPGAPFTQAPGRWEGQGVIRTSGLKGSRK